MCNLKECHEGVAPHLSADPANTSLCFMPLTEGGVHLLVTSEEHLCVQASASASCGQAVIDALFVSVALGDQVVTRGFISPPLGKKDRGEVGRQVVISLAKEPYVTDFPYNTWRQWRGEQGWVSSYDFGRIYPLLSLYTPWGKGGRRRGRE